MDIDLLVTGLFETLGRLLMREVYQETDVQIITEVLPESFVCHVVLPCLGGIGFEGMAAATEEEAQALVVQLCLESFGAAGEAASMAIKAASKLMPHPPRAPPSAAVFQDVVTIDDGGAEEWPKAQPQVLQVGRLFQPAPKIAPKVKAMPKPAKISQVPQAQPANQQPAPPSEPPPTNGNWIAQTAQGSEPKVLLHGALTKIIGTPPTKADVEYHTDMVEEGHQCILILNCIEGKGFAGFPCAAKKDAEHSAAAVALEWLRDNAGVNVQPPAASRKRPQPVGMALPVDVEVQSPPAKKAKKANQVVRTLSSGSIQSAEGIACCVEWRDTRLEPCTFQDIQEPSSIQFYFGQACLACQAIVSIKGWDAHAYGKKHLSRLKEQPMKLRENVERPLPLPPLELLDPELFVETGGWGQPDALGMYPSVLTLGEMDYSFSLAVAELRPPGSALVATSYLAEHDPSEVETHPSDDGERAAYKRLSLPGMNGALQKNLDALAELGAEVYHSVDATDLAGTLQTQGCQAAFHSVVFPFPRYSLSRAPNPNNSRLLRDFFISVLRDGLLLDDGSIQLVMLSAQYEEWDVNGMASDVGLILTSRVRLPQNFYQAREMSGKPWTPPGAELLTFKLPG